MLDTIAFSISENTITEYISFSLLMDYEFHTRSWLYLYPTAEFEYKHRYFEARNGYGWYGDENYRGSNGNVPWNSDGAKYYSSGKLNGIDYNWSSFGVYVGGKIKFLLPYNVSVLLYGAVSPFTHIEAIDKHYTNSTNTKSSDSLDIVKTYFSRVKASATIYYSFTDYLDVGLSFSGFWGLTRRGVTSSWDEDDEEFYKADGYESGSSMYEGYLQLSCRVRIF